MSKLSAKAKRARTSDHKPCGKLKASGRPAAEARRANVDAGVASSTLKSYLSRFKVYTEFCAQIGTCPDEPDAFHLFIQDRRSKSQGAEQTRSAIVHMQLREGKDPWAQGDEFVRACRGADAACRARHAEKGQLSDQQISEYERVCMEAGDVEARDCGRVLKAASLRISEAKNIRECDVEAGGGGLSVAPDGLILRNEKSASKERVAKGRAPLVRSKPIPRAALQAIMAAKKKQYGKAGFVFSQHVDRRIRMLLKSTAERFGWDPSLKWDGPHVFRHTGAGAQARRLAPVLKAVERSLTQQLSLQSSSTFKKYAKPNEGRRRATRA